MEEHLNLVEQATYLLLDRVLKDLQVLRTFKPTRPQRYCLQTSRIPVKAMNRCMHLPFSPGAGRRQSV